MIGRWDLRQGRVITGTGSRGGGGTWIVKLKGHWLRLTSSMRLHFLKVSQPSQTPPASDQVLNMCAFGDISHPINNSN